MFSDSDTSPRTVEPLIMVPVPRQRPTAAPIWKRIVLPEAQPIIPPPVDPGMLNRPQEETYSELVSKYLLAKDSLHISQIKEEETAAQNYLAILAGKLALWHYTHACPLETIDYWNQAEQHWQTES